MSIEINQTPQKSSLNIFQFPNIKSQSVSNLTENKTHKIGSQ